MGTYEMSDRGIRLASLYWGTRPLPAHCEVKGSYSSGFTQGALLYQTEKGVWLCGAAGSIKQVVPPPIPTNC